MSEPLEYFIQRLVDESKANPLPIVPKFYYLQTDDCMEAIWAFGSFYGHWTGRGGVTLFISEDDPTCVVGLRVDGISRLMPAKQAELREMDGEVKG